MKQNYVLFPKNVCKITLTGDVCQQATGTRFFKATSILLSLSLLKITPGSLTTWEN